jgi:hypothetical protein
LEKRCRSRRRGLLVSFRPRPRRPTTSTSSRRKGCARATQGLSLARFIGDAHRRAQRDPGLWLRSQNVALRRHGSTDERKIACCCFDLSLFILPPRNMPSRLLTAMFRVTWLSCPRSARTGANARLEKGGQVNRSVPPKNGHGWKAIVIRYLRILQGRKASVKSGCKLCGWGPPAKPHPLFGDHAEMPLDVAPSHLQLICACRCHSQPVPMRRISEDGTRRDIFGGMRVARVSDGTTTAVDAFLSNKRGAER